MAQPMRKHTQSYQQRHHQCAIVVMLLPCWLSSAMSYLSLFVQQICTRSARLGLTRRVHAHSAVRKNAPGSMANADGCLHLVACQHPNLDAGS
jgi:hypothetical protein